MDDSMELTSAKLDNWKKVVPFTCLPKTIQDAVLCTRHIGLSYLWVDRLCIIPDDELDKEIEIAAMPQQICQLTYQQI